MDEEQWQYAQDNFSKEEIKECLVEILMEYEPPYMEISEKECLRDYRKLKGVKCHNKLKYTILLAWARLLKNWKKALLQQAYRNR